MRGISTSRSLCTFVVMLLGVHQHAANQLSSRDPFSPLQGLELALGLYVTIDIFALAVKGNGN